MLAIWRVVRRKLFNGILLNWQNKLHRYLFHTSNASCVRVETQLNENLISLDNDTVIVKMKWGGLIAVDPKNVDQLVGLVVNREWEPSVTRVIMDRVTEGSQNVVVGTSFGYYPSLIGILAGQNSRTYAIEANSNMIDYLIRTGYWSGVINQLTIHNSAISHVSGQSVMLKHNREFTGAVEFEFETKQKSSTLHNSTHRWKPENLLSMESSEGFLQPGFGVQDYLEIKTRTLDEIVRYGEISILKMDIEGMEANAILGAKNLIERSRNLYIIMEMSNSTFEHADAHQKDLIRKAWNYLEQQKFVCFRITPSESFNREVALDPINTFEDWIQSHHADFLFERK